MEGGDLDRRLPRPIGCQRSPAGDEMQWGTAHSRDYAADAPITHEPVSRARPQPASALAERPLLAAALHKRVQPIAAQARAIARAIKSVAFAGATVPPCLGAKAELFAVGLRP